MTKAPGRPRDLNQWAKRMVDIATGDVKDASKTTPLSPASEFARLGGLKGGEGASDRFRSCLIQTSLSASPSPHSPFTIPRACR
jgi:hypothetical protein